MCVRNWRKQKTFQILKDGTKTHKMAKLFTILISTLGEKIKTCTEWLQLAWSRFMKVLYETSTSQGNHSWVVSTVVILNRFDCIKITNLPGKLKWLNTDKLTWKIQMAWHHLKVCLWNICKVWEKSGTMKCGT